MARVKNIRLGTIAEILIGLPDNRRLELVDAKNMVACNLVQPNHLGVFNDIQNTLEIKRQTPIDAEYFIRKDDILLKRLNPVTATLITDDLPDTVFSSNLFVVRLFRDYRPAYIACLLENQGISWLSGNIVGSLTAIKSISIRALAELEIPVLDWGRQEAIGRMWLLHKKRQRLLGDLMAEDRRLMSAATRSITTSAEEED